MLNNSSTFRTIATEIDKDPSTVAKEVKAHFIIKDASATRSCTKIKTCELRTSTGILCSKKCNKRDVPACTRLLKPPYVCNGCERKKYCRLKKKYYKAKVADATYRQCLSSSRAGVRINPEAFCELDAIVSDLVRKGQSLAHICHTQGNKIFYCERQLYRHFDANLFSARNIDWPRKVRFKRRKNKKPAQKADKIIAERDYKSFQRFVQANPDALFAEGDTVHGSTKTSLFTLILPRCHLMLARIIPDLTRESVIRAFDEIQELLKISSVAIKFEQLLPAVLVDNGVEFNATERLETTNENDKRTKIYYCDPYASYQKPHVERNHSIIRQVIPKTENIAKYTQYDIDKMMSHINSYARDSLQWKTPYQAFCLFYGEPTAKALGMFPVSPSDVCLRPGLIKRE
jgi:IS30 family transposase